MDQERLVRQPRGGAFPDPWLVIAFALALALGLALGLPWWGTGLVGGGLVFIATTVSQRRRRTRASSQTGSSAS